MMKIGGAHASIDRSRAVCLARVLGRVDLATVGQLIEEIGGPDGAGQLIHVIDYSSALVEIADDELMRVAAAIAQRDAGEAIPAALIANSSQSAAFRRFSDIAGRAGVIANVFSCVESAQRWADTQAGVMSYWADCRRRLSSP